MNAVSVLDETPAPETPRSSLRERFERDGLVGPIDLLSTAACGLLTRHFDAADRPVPLDWHKGLGPVDRLVYEVATLPVLVEHVVALIGPDVLLYGASVVDRVPGQVHPWHSDIESSQPGCRFVTAWIGLENVSSESALQLLAGTHRAARPLQQVAAEAQCPREARDAATAATLARASGIDVVHVQPDMRDGQALLFDVRLWHGSLNSRMSGRRRALLLQFASADSVLRIPDFTSFDWPFSFKDSPRPAVVSIAGRADASIHRLVAAPQAANQDLARLHALGRPLPWPLARDTATGWKPTPLCKGSTPVLHKLGCHASVLEPGCSPHPPHAHRNEEILVVLEGEAEILIAGSETDPAPRIERLTAGDLVYYPSYQHHTIRCPGPSPVSYLMYRWTGPLAQGDAAPGVSIFRRGQADATQVPGGFATRRLFESPTPSLTRLHAHWSQVLPGGGYAAHVDEHDVAIVLFQGAVVTLGRRVEAPAVVLYPAGERHGLRGEGRVPAEYLVVEFHGRHLPGSPTLGDRLRRVRRRLGALARRLYPGSAPTR